MQHLTNSKELFAATKTKPEQEPLPEIQWHRVKSDPTRAWLRLNEATIPLTAPVRQPIDPDTQAAIDLLRSRLLRQMRQNGIRKLALTAPTHGCGTTTLATRLALGLASQIDLKVMLIDLNLRKPELCNQFAITGTTARQTALTGTRREFDSSAVRVGHNLALSLFTQPEPQAAEALGTLRARALIKQLEREFEPDLMIFDLPPALAVDDVVAAADLYDAALLVARADHSTADQIDRAERLISEQKPCVGVVMNACRFGLADDSHR